MGKKNIISVVVCFLLITTLRAQSNYSVIKIQEELLENANAVVRESNTLIELNALDEMIITEKRVVTVLNRFGDKLLDTYVNYDDSSKVLKLSALVLNANGEEIKKVKYSDFKDVSTVSGGQMYTDNRVKYLDYTPSSYPYTVVFNYKIKEKSTAFIKSWYPLDNYYQSVEKNRYEFVNNSVSEHKYKKYNADFLDIEIIEESNNLVFLVENVKAVEREERSPNFNEIFPRILVAINDFMLKGVKGNVNSWESYGLWQYKDLLTGRDNLDDKTVAEVSKLLLGVNDKKEKIKRVYEYMQDRTRYVGVQLGIGGWQPIKASEVDEVKYGDCKGLTNYTKALLKSQGIESYYTIVYAGVKRDIDNQFSSLQGNHVILNVPLEKEDIWLECTSQTMPFNFLGDFTDDRDVLVVTPRGGEIKHTPIYGEEISTLITNAKINIEVDGKIKAIVSLKSKGLQYNDRSYLSSLATDKKELVYLDRWDYLNGIKINQVEIKEDKELIELKERVDLNIDNYLTKVGEKYLVQLNMFNRQVSVPSSYEKRNLPFKIGMSFKDVDIYEYVLPPGMKVESLPKDFVLKSKFGEYTISVTSALNNRIQYKRELTIKKGTYTKDEYTIYRDFIKKVKKKDKLKVLIIKE